MEKLPKNIYNVQYRFSPFLFRSYLLSNLELPSSIHTLKWNHFCLHFLFRFWLTLVNTDCGDYNFVVVVVPFMPVKADQVLGLTEARRQPASILEAKKNDVSKNAGSCWSLDGVLEVDFLFHLARHSPRHLNHKKLFNFALLCLCNVQILFQFWCWLS